MGFFRSSLARKPLPRSLVTCAKKQALARRSRHTQRTQKPTRPQDKMQQPRGKEMTDDKNKLGNQDRSRVSGGGWLSRVQIRPISGGTDRKGRQ